jgi:phenylacetate-CoA ligase
LIIIEKIENWLISHPRILQVVLTRFPSRILESIGEWKLIPMIRIAIKEVPAYKKFLVNHNFDINNINFSNYKDLLPEINKENYIYQFGLEERCRNGVFPSTGSIDESAGSSGRTTMWIRSHSEEIKLQSLTNFGIRYTLQRDIEPGLIVLNCWSAGPWATGIKFSMLAEKNAVVKSIGTNKENCIETLIKLGNNFEYLIAGYPPFIKEILDYGDQNGINWADYKINILTGGEGFTEAWRGHIQERLGGWRILGKNERKYGGVYSAYGASDIDIGIAFETELSIMIRAKADINLDFRRKIFGENMPVFFGVYNPLVYHILMNEKNELLFTTLNPEISSLKIKYNLKDRGLIIPFSTVRKIIKDTKFNKRLAKTITESLKLPFIAIYGRSDGTVSLDGANIYPSDVQSAIFKSPHAKFINSFKIGNLDEQDKHKFTVYLELSDSYKESQIDKSIIHHFKELIMQNLLIENKDYKESWQNNPKILEPSVKLFEYRQGYFAEPNRQIKYKYLL